MIEFKPRFFVPPVIALTVLALLHAPADGGRSTRGDCGPAWHVADPGIRASFAAFQRRQSAAAAQVCALANNNMPR